MSGSSKSKNIKSRKDAQDKKRSREFSRIVKEIYTAIKMGGDQPETNPQLRLAIQQAKGANMPKANIERALQKGAGSDASLQTMIFEAYAAGGVALQIECVTDNGNRTVAMIRSSLRRHNAELAAVGALQHILVQRGRIECVVPGLEAREEELLSAMLEWDTEDFQRDGDRLSICCPVKQLSTAEADLDALGAELLSCGAVCEPTVEVPLDASALESLDAWLDQLQEEDDVISCFHNAVLAP